jgi:hypothetical protein
MRLAKLAKPAGEYDKRLEGRIVIRGPHGTRRADLKTEVGMYDPGTGNYAPLGAHRGNELERQIRQLAQQMAQAGNRVTFSQLS